jgi:hypothetical protein
LKRLQHMVDQMAESQSIDRPSDAGANGQRQKR